MIFYEWELDIDNKLNNFLKITGILNNVFRPKKTLKKTRIKLYNTLAIPVLLYGSETWTVKASDARRITAAEMNYMRRTAGYTWTDYKTDAQISKELKITPILDKLLEYERRWIQHVNRMPRNRLPKVMKYYSPTGRRNQGRPLKILLDRWDRNGQQVAQLHERYMMMMMIAPRQLVLLSALPKFFSFLLWSQRGALGCSEKLHLDWC